MRIYIAGPMRGYMFWNYEAFDRAEVRLREMGFEVVNPAALDRVRNGHPSDWMPAADTDFSTSPSNETIQSILLRDLAELGTCDKVGLLHGWAFSYGALAEIAFADAVGIEVLELKTLGVLTWN